MSFQYPCQWVDFSIAKRSFGGLSAAARERNRQNGSLLTKGSLNGQNRPRGGDFAAVSLSLPLLQLLAVTTIQASNRPQCGSVSNLQ